MAKNVELRDKYNKGRADGVEEGISQGITQGITRINTLNTKLAEMGRGEEMLRAASDAELQAKLMKELGI